MADVRWTEEQQKVIELRKRNLLVSAAAGSGKTAVLVERIIRMVTDPSNHVDIDRLLVMTFTNAAAAEMRERIGAAIEKRLAAHPGDANLERQSTLIHHAKITTIDSFCSKLLREHFNELDIDPGFRVGEEGEMLLIQADVMRELLEDYYGREDERFFRFVDTFATGKADGGLEDYILKIHRFSQSNPWPKEWIAKCRDELILEGSGDLDELGRTEWMRFLLADVKRQAEEFADQIAEAAELAGEADGPGAYLPMLAEDLRNMQELKDAGTYLEVYRILNRPLFGKLAAVRGKDADPEKKEAAAGLRNRVKDAVKKMKALYIPGGLDQMISDMENSREPVLMLLELAEEFDARYGREKRERNLLDFNDLEHFALQILTGNSADHSPGPVADSLSQFYREILVDEYQDSNLVQEKLISCISRERFGDPDVFMVGDVKQSIYRFRLAKPELFLEKYERYSSEDGARQKIELHKNFRSRPEVLSGINKVFYGIMTKALGNIAYTEEAALHPGADYPALPDGPRQGTGVELILLNTGDAVFKQMDDARADYTAKEAEARLIAQKIREMTGRERGMKIWDGKEGKYVPLRKKDIVILLRSLSGWSEEFVNVLNSEGIPAAAESQTGYFTAVEVETVLNMLSLIDNPMQDIPFAGVLKSPIGGLSDRELASVAAAYRRNPEKGQDEGMYAAVKYYLTYGRDRELSDKLRAFLELLAGLREEARDMPVRQLIYRVFERTGYYDYASAMPAGRVRKANLDMLVQKAADYGRTSYEGLFDFVRYIEKLRKYDTDFGEASAASGKDDLVRIMSIHKSKGLEFPVVFLAGAGKQFNRQDAREKIIIDEELGIAADFYDLEWRVKAQTLKKNVLSRRMNLDNMGEELRVLYVAMTRAKEKLIITAGDRYLDNKLEKWKNTPPDGGHVPFIFLSSANSYLDWLLMAAARTGPDMAVSEVSAGELLAVEVAEQAEKLELRKELERLQKEAPAGVCGETRENLDRLLKFCYPFEADVALHVKLSVSELKQRGQFVDDAESDFLPTIPEFMMGRAARPEEEISGMPDAPKKAGPEAGAPGQSGTAAGPCLPEPGPSGPCLPGPRPSEPGSPGEAGQRAAAGMTRGTAYHRALELLDFTKIESEQDVSRQLSELLLGQRISGEAHSLLSARVLMRVLNSGVGRRMRAAAKAGNLFKERQFVIGIPARLMDEADSDERVLIQGIIDVWFEEPDGLVLVDYKTDRIRPGEEHVLLDRYQLQMVYYEQALSQITGKKVKERIIYSLSLQKEISA